MGDLSFNILIMHVGLTFKLLDHLFEVPRVLLIFVNLFTVLLLNLREVLQDGIPRYVVDALITHGGCLVVEIK